MPTLQLLYSFFLLYLYLKKKHLSDEPVQLTVMLKYHATLMIKDA